VSTFSIVSQQYTLTQETPTPNSSILQDTWTPISSGTVFTASSKASRGGYGHIGDLFRHPQAGNVIEGSVLIKTLSASSDTYDQVPLAFQATLAQETPTPNSPILQDTWTPVSSGTVFTASSKASRGGYGHVGDLFRHPQAGNVIEGAVLEKTLVFYQSPSSTITTKQITGVSDIRVTTVQTILGRGSIGVLTDRTITGQADLKNFRTQTITGVGSVQVTTTKTISGQSDIGVISVKTITGQADLQAYTVKTLSGTGDISKTTTKTISGQSDIGAIITKLIQGTADIRKYTTQSLPGAGDIQKTTTQTLTGQADIGVLETQTITGQADLKNHTTKTISGQADLQNYATKTTTGASFLVFKRSQTISGQSFLVFKRDKTITGAGDIRNFTTKTITGAGSVARTSLRSLVGFSMIVDKTVQTITGASDIKAHTVQALPGAGDIQSFTTQTITGAGFCQPPIQRIFGRADIQAYITKTITGASFLITEGSAPTAPSTLSVTGTGSATLVWSASTDVGGVLTGYVIERAPCSSMTFTTIATVSASTLTYTDNPGPGCFQYYVYAVNSFGQTSGHSPTESITLTFTTTVQNISGQAALQLGTQQDINGQACIVTSTPSLGVRLTQVNEQISENKFPNVLITQANLMAAENRKVNVNITQAVLQVAMIYLGSYNHSFPGGTNNRGQG